MSKRDYYEILEVTRDAGPDQIKKSYRKLALRFHPDRNPGDQQAEEQFKEATQAYQILSDQEARRKYDTFGHAAFESGGGFHSGDFSGFAEDIFGDIFGAFFGMRGGGFSGGRQAGRDLRYNLTLTLLEAAFGVEKQISFNRPSPCKSCSGTGARDGRPANTCRKCAGTGQVRIQQGFFAISRPCPGCQGTGVVIEDQCQDCRGQGLVNETTSVMVKVPPGIDEGQRLKIRGEGERPASGAAHGDLYVSISIEPHPVFQRQGADIICEVPIGYSQAVMGGEVEVPTLQGEITMKIPAGTPSGKVFRLRGKGIVDIQTGRSGDEHVRTYVHVPQHINERQSALLQELAEIEGKPVKNDSRSLLEKVKDLFE